MTTKSNSFLLKNRSNGGPFVFNAEVAIRVATITVYSLSSTWKCKFQESDKKEIIAEAVAKAWSHRESYNPARASFQTWVGRIARNTMLDHMRKAKSRECSPAQVQDIKTSKSPDTLMMESEGLEFILQAVHSLPKEYRNIILFLSEGKRTQEIAKILGCSTNAASIRCCRARKALRELLQKNEQEKRSS